MHMNHYEEIIEKNPDDIIKINPDLIGGGILKTMHESSF